MSSNFSQENEFTPKPPQPGKDAELIFHVESQEKPPENTEGNIDYRELSPFQEIAAGTVIVEKILATEGVPGTDDLGNSIPAPPGKDVAFNPKENIRATEADGKITYTSSVDGILTFDKKSANVQEVFNVNSDVDSKTGNIHFKKNVLIKGDVKGGYTVNCGGDLFIKGGIENSSKIICQGNLTVGRGVFGEDTEIEVHGNAEMGFLQNTQVTVNGNLIVNKYIYDSRVLCRGHLTVVGRSVSGDEKGSVVGGCINSVGSMELHSVGSPMAQTHLICGTDAERVSQIEKLENLSQVLKKKLIGTQKRIGFDLSDSKALAKMEDLPIKRKAQIKELLIEFKETSVERETVLEKIKKLESYEVSVNIKEVAVRINKHLVPNVLLEIGNISKLLEQPLKNKTFQIQDETIIQR